MTQPICTTLRYYPTVPSESPCSYSVPWRLLPGGTIGFLQIHFNQPVFVQQNCGAIAAIHSTYPPVPHIQRRNIDNSPTFNGLHSMPHTRHFSDIVSVFFCDTALPHTLIHFLLPYNPLRCVLIAESRSNEIVHIDRYLPTRQPDTAT